MTVNYEVMLEQLSQLLNEQGDYCDFGCSEDLVDEMIIRAKELFPTKPYCAVARWSWADIEVDSELAGAIREAGLKPSFIYSSRLISDEKNRWEKEICIRTSLLADFQPPCFFCSRNTVYILCGTGVRLKVIPAVFNNLFLD